MVVLRALSLEKGFQIVAQGALLQEISGKQKTQQLEMAEAWTDSGYELTNVDGVPVDPNLTTKAICPVSEP